MIRRFLVPACTAASVFVAGCVSIPGMPGGGASNAGPAVTADTPLIDVIVPGSVRNSDTPANMQMDPLLDPRTPVPAFAEANILRSYCQPGQQVDARNDKGEPLANGTGFDQLMRAGVATARARQVWQFQTDRMQRQRAQAEGFARRIDPARLERMRQEYQLQEQWLREMQAAAAAGKTGPAAQQEFQRRAPKVMITAAHRIPKALDELRYNEAVLRMQDARLQTQEEAYLDQLLGDYKSAFEKFSAVPANRLSLKTLGQFERYRFYNVQACAERGRLTQTGRGLSEWVRVRYEQLLPATVAATRSEALSDLVKSGSSSELQERFLALYPTPLLQDVAGQDTELMARLQARKTVLVAAEERAREVARKQALAAEARRLAEIKRQYRDKAARNVAPTTEEVATLVTTYTMEKTAARGELGRLERTGDNSFNDYSKVSWFGQAPVGSNAIEVAGLSCRFAQGRQRCSFAWTPRFTELLLGQVVRSYDGTPDTQEADFLWTENGLEAPVLKDKLGGVGYPARASERVREDPFDAYWKREERRRDDDVAFQRRQRTDPDFRRATNGY